MRILIVVGMFPSLSESFILRKVIALAQRGHRIIVAARDPSISQLLDDYSLLPQTLEVIYLTPDSRIRQPDRILRIVENLARALILHPTATYSLYNFLGKNATTSGLLQRVRLFLRYLSFLGVECDIIHFEFSQLPAMYRLLPKMLDKPYVVSSRGSDINLFALRSTEEQNNIISTLQSASVVHVVSERMASILEQISVERARIWINKPAVDLQRIVPIIRDLDTDTPQILTTGRLVWIKGLDYLLAAYAILKKRGVKFRARIVGDGNLKHELLFSLDDLELNDCVEFLGPLPSTEVIRELAQADLFVLSSHAEGISNSVLEAMATGLPIVTTDAGGMREAVRDGIDGFVVPPRDPSALADRIEILAKDPVLRRKFGSSARERVVSEFDMNRQSERFEQMYFSVLTNR